MTSAGPIRIAVFSSPDNAAVKALPVLNPAVAEFSIVSSFEECVQLSGISAVVIIPPFSQDVVDEVWDSACRDVRWVHTFSAGVDFVARLIKRRLLGRADILLTNGRGAFSRCRCLY